MSPQHTLIVHHKPQCGHVASSASHALVLWYMFSQHITDDLPVEIPADTIPIIVGPEVEIREGLQFIDQVMNYMIGKGIEPLQVSLDLDHEEQCKQIILHLVNKGVLKSAHFADDYKSLPRQLLHQ